MFQERIKQLRNAKRLTQADVAEKIGITRPAYTAYETGKRQPDFDILQKLATLFDVSTDYLLGRTDDKEKAPTLVAAHLDDDLTEEQLDEVKNFIDFIKQRDHGGK